MRKRLLVVALSTWSFVGCLNTSSVIRVAPDGSGSMEQTIMFNIKNVEKAFAGMGMKPSGKFVERPKPIDEAAMKEAAEQLGNGVTLVSVTPIKEPSGFEGVTIRFRFDDITKLKTEEVLMPSSAKEASSSSGKSRVAFAMSKTPSGSSILTATFAEGDGTKSGSKSGKSSKGGPPLDDPEVAQMVKTLFKGFRRRIDLVTPIQPPRSTRDGSIRRRFDARRPALSTGRKSGKAAAGPGLGITAGRPGYATGPMALGVQGVLVGCWTAPDGDTGTTVVLPPPGTIGGAALRGGAPGSRETDALSPTGSVEACHAVVLTGGSAFGLAAADGVMAWCEGRGLGYELPAVTVPIVGAAVCFDIRRRGQRRPWAQRGLGRL